MTDFERGNTAEYERAEPVRSRSWRRWAGGAAVVLAVGVVGYPVYVGVEHVRNLTQHDPCKVSASLGPTTAEEDRLESPDHVEGTLQIGSLADSGRPPAVSFDGHAVALPWPSGERRVAFGHNFDLRIVVGDDHLTASCVAVS